MIAFFKNLLTKKEKQSQSCSPIVQFGRYSDFYKHYTKNKAWDKSLEEHQRKNYFESILQFFEYITDEDFQNVTVENHHDKKISFQVCQGSKTLEGFANEDGFFAEVKIAQCHSLSLPVLRMLLEENFNLRYSTYALDSTNKISLVMHADFLDATPYKLYYGLKEMATIADRRDDVLVQKFESLTPLINGRIKSITTEEKKIKIEYFKTTLSATLASIESNRDSLQAHPALISYQILCFIFSIDYLLKPEGLLLDNIDNSIKIFYQSQSSTFDIKINAMLKELKAMTHLPDKELESEFYDTVSTFGVLMSGSHTRVCEIIESDMKHYRWYIDNGYADHAGFIPQYIAGYLLYTYAIPLPDKLYLHTLLRVWQDDYFRALGFLPYFKNNNLEKSIIVQDCEDIETSLSDQFESSSFIKVKNLDFNDKHAFSESLLKEVLNLNIVKIRR